MGEEVGGEGRVSVVGLSVVMASFKRHPLLHADRKVSLAFHYELRVFLNVGSESDGP